VTSAVVGGALANKAGFGGEAWVRMSWVTGLRQLGLDTWFVEDIDSASCTDAFGAPSSARDSDNLRYFEATVAAFGLSDRAILRVDGGNECYGAGDDALAALGEAAALVINIGGPPSPRPTCSRPRRASTSTSTPAGRSSGTPRATPRPASPVTTRSTRLPRTSERRAARSLPPASPGARPANRSFSQIGRSCRRSARAGSRRSQPGATASDPPVASVESIRSFATWSICHAAPARASRWCCASRPRTTATASCSNATAGTLVDPDAVRTPDAFRSYVQGSDAEFSAAQGVYARTGSGWFSDRSVRYPPRVGAAGAGAGHRPRRPPTGRRGCGHLRFARHRTRRRGAQSSASTTRTRARRARSPSSTSTRISCSVGCSTRWVSRDGALEGEGPAAAVPRQRPDRRLPRAGRRDLGRAAVRAGSAAARSRR